MAYAVEMNDICKNFPGVRANDHITITIEKGEIHGLLGENGSGKTTLMNVLFGLYQPDSGKIMINGQEVIMDGPRKAINLGIEMIHQHFMLIKNFTVAENIILGDEPSTRFKILNRQEISKNVSELLKQVGFQLDLNALIEDLSVGLQQRVEILKALYRKTQILILDEPTSVLTPQEADELFVTMKKLKEQGVTIIFISHKLREIMAICDKVTVLRRGKVIGTVRTTDTKPSELANMMVGREVLFRLDKKEATIGRIILKIQNLSAINERGIMAVDDVSFTVHAGEIVGIAGVQGNGQSELIEVLTGLRRSDKGKVEIDGISAVNLTPNEVLNRGVAHIPEDRQGRGLILTFSIMENMILGIHHNPNFTKLSIFNIDKIRTFAEDCVKNFEIKLVDLDSSINTLSGGNQQKVILARELLGRKPKLIIAAQPTHGLDVGVIEYVHKTLTQMRDQGLAILLVSTELDEIRDITDRAFVMFEGRIMAEINPQTISDKDVSLLMAGIKPEDEE
ncbi:MAG: ABC transporter ATP-binding protein [Candidatus Thorarchaeota archaeon]